MPKTSLEKLKEYDLLTYLKIRAESQQQVEREIEYKKKIKNSRKWK